MSEKPAIILHMPTRIDNSLLLEDHEILKIHVPVPNLACQCQLGSRSPRPCVNLSSHVLEEKLASRLGAPASLSKMLLTPEDFKKFFNTPYGAPFSLQNLPFAGSMVPAA